jgi:type VI secretion system secreted protein VgrG
MNAPAGIAALTPESATLNSGTHTTITAGQDLNVLAQGALVINAAKGLSLYTHGKAQNGQKPNQETGIKLHAASGKVSLQSQSDKTQIAAGKQVTIASAQSTVTIAAPGAKLQLIAAGAGVSIEGGNVTLKAPGAVIVGARSQSWLDRPA